MGVQKKEKTKDERERWKEKTKAALRGKKRNKRRVLEGDCHLP